MAYELYRKVEAYPYLSFHIGYQGSALGRSAASAALVICRSGQVGHRQGVATKDVVPLRQGVRSLSGAQVD